MQGFKKLEKNGHQIYRTRPAWQSYWGSWLTLGASVALCARFYTDIPQDAYAYIAGWLILLYLFIAGRRQMETFDIIDGQVVRAHKGLILRKRRDLTLSPQVHVDMEQSIIGRILNYATLRFWTGDDRSTASWGRITSPERVSREIEDLKGLNHPSETIPIAEKFEDPNATNFEVSHPNLPFSLQAETGLRPAEEFRFFQPLDQTSRPESFHQLVQSSTHGTAPRSDYRVSGHGQTITVTHEPSSKSFSFGVPGYIWSKLISASGRDLFVCYTPFSTNFSDSRAVIVRYVRNERIFGNGFKFNFKDEVNLSDVDHQVVIYKFLSNGSFLAMLNRGYRESSATFNIGPAHLVLGRSEHPLVSTESVASGGGAANRQLPDVLGSVALNLSESFLVQLSYVERGRFPHLGRYGQTSEQWFKPQIRVYDLQNLSLAASLELDEKYALVDQEGYRKIDPYQRVGVDISNDRVFGLNVGTDKVRSFRLN